MRVVLLSIIVAGMAGVGCSEFGGGEKPGRPRMPRTSTVLFRQLDSKAIASAKDTIIRQLSSDTFIVHITVPDSCLRPNAPVPPCPPLLKAAKTDTIIRQ